MTLLLVIFWLFHDPVVTSAQCLTAQLRQSTFAERFSEAEVSVVARWVASQEGSKETPGRTAYRVERILKGNQVNRVDHLIYVNAHYPAKPVDRFIVLGAKNTETNQIDWYSWLNISPTNIPYIVHAPSPQIEQAKRLPYFIKFINHSDSSIADDALAETSKSSIRDFQQITSQLPREEIRKWLNDAANNDGTRVAVYGLMLGVCGDASDATLLEKRILIKADEYRMGIDAVMCGYLLLTKEKGLSVLEKSKMQDKTVLFSEAFSAMQAVKFMWTESSAISQDRLRQSMRILLDRSDIADFVIADLIRWKDWSSQDRLMEMYPACNPATKRQIILFLIANAKDRSRDKTGAVPIHVTKALKAIQNLREKDLLTVSQAEGFLNQLQDEQSNLSP
jgi:hypothetical protein